MGLILVPDCGSWCFGIFVAFLIICFSYFCAFVAYASTYTSDYVKFSSVLAFNLR